MVRRRTRLTEIEVKYYAQQIVKGLIYIHKSNVIHRDLKLGNLFLADGMQVKIGDFGLSTKLSDRAERKTSVCGTPNYIAPEVLEGDRFHGHSFEVDVWAFGVIVYIMLFGKAPFDADEPRET